jgi:hypothetical protein
MFSLSTSSLLVWKVRCRWDKVHVGGKRLGPHICCKNCGVRTLVLFVRASLGRVKDGLSQFLCLLEFHTLWL